ncbi:MAG: immunoglobulin domain-containing protein [Candidatus Omnitrophica bacterium]|nr:immunoglobulin domain-containing protein [Candidatus Omnitrophota bacterium]
MRLRCRRLAARRANGQLWKLDGIPIFEASLQGSVTSRGELMSMGSLFVPNPAEAADRGIPDWQAVESNPPVSPRLAVAVAARAIGETVDVTQIRPVDEPSAGPEKKQTFESPMLKWGVVASLEWLPMDRQTMHLCWDVYVGSSAGLAFEVLVDAVGAEVHIRQCWAVVDPPQAPESPSLVMVPASQAALAGNSVTFKVIAAGTCPLSYQWMFDGAELADQTNAVLTLTNLQPASAGSYTVRITDRLGAQVVTQPAVLNISWGGEELKFTSVKKDANGKLVFEWTGGGTLQFKTDLSQATGWIDVPGAINPYALLPTEKVILVRIRR